MFYEEFLQLMSSANSGREVEGGLVVKFDGKVHAFGEVPAALARSRAASRAGACAGNAAGDG
jgi:hypothetical protein